MDTLTILVDKLNGEAEVLTKQELKDRGYAWMTQNDFPNE